MIELRITVDIAGRLTSSNWFFRGVVLMVGTEIVTGT